ncbi:ABC transporter ATP-binding protein [Treponema pedis]|uniref:ABC transporter ATP-binding protein n=4 Tax=Treponema pedis TaxID=409322 RepID=S5ZXA9_9SPIR|nr:ABC transporter ATP-binding protein [Treponema pedis]AGT45090.1 ABC transporter ATP-binding protein [Treponema pedis str. T A4]
MNNKQAFFYFLRFTKKHIILFISFAFCFFSCIGLTLYIPQVFQKFIDGIGLTVYGNKTIILLGLTYLIIVLAGELLQNLRDILSTIFSWKLTEKVRQDIFRNILNLDIEFYSQHSAGELTECIDGDSEALASSASGFLLDIAANILILLGVLLIIFLISVKLGLLFSFFSCISFFSMLKLSESGTYAVKEVRKTEEKITSLVTEAITGREELHILKAENKILQKLTSLYMELFKYKKAFRLRFIFTVELNNFILLLEKCGLIIFLFIFYKNNLISLGQSFMLYNYFMFLEWPIQTLAEKSTTFQGLSANISRISRLINKRPKIGFGSKKMDSDTYSIEFKNVSFSYSSREKVLDSINFKIEAGQHCGLQGRTGSGKTTLIKLLLGLYVPSQGSILFNGIPIFDFSKEELMKGIGYVSQEITLFYASIRDNVRMFDKSISDEQINEVLKKSGMYEKISALPGGLDYICEDGGANFSSGETQLLACARLFLKKSKIIILDEPTAKLDKEEQEKLSMVFAELIKNKTAILIAHRKETLQNMDCLILEKGKLESVKNLGGWYERQ